MAKINKCKTPAQKAAHTRKWHEAQRKSLATARNAKTFAKDKLSQKGYRCISLDTRKGYEYKGVVDLVAIKRDTRNPDRLKIVLVQVKGGGAKVTDDELRRLEEATKRIEADWNVAEKSAKVVQFKKPLEELKKPNAIKLRGIWKGVRIADKDIKEARQGLLKKLEEKF